MNIKLRYNDRYKKYVPTVIDNDGQERGVVAEHKVCYSCIYCDISGHICGKSMRHSNPSQDKPLTDKG